MLWTEALACFAAGLFLTNGVPHFVKGICGDRFPTPFAKPPGRGLSSPTLNVVWALGNFALGLLLARVGGVDVAAGTGRWVAATAGVLFAFWSSWSFARKHAAN
jgi:hypothetical protein